MSAATDTNGYSAEIHQEASEYPRLGGEYFAAKAAAERFLSKWREEDAEHLAEAIMKPVLDAVHDKVWDSFRDFILSDTESNVADTMRRMVEDSVRALIGGEKWANVKYLQSEYGDGQKVRETLAKLYSDEIKDGRIADLEKEIASLKDRLKWAEAK